MTTHHLPRPRPSDASDGSRPIRDDDRARATPWRGPSGSWTRPPEGRASGLRPPLRALAGDDPSLLLSMTAGPGFKIQISTGPYPARAVLLALAGETISKSIFVAAHELDDVIVALVEARRRVIERWGAAALRREHEGPWGTWAPSKRATDVTLVAGVVDTPDAEVER